MSVSLEPGSFRDRTNRVFYQDGAVFRFLDAAALQNWQAVSSKAFFRRLTNLGKIIETSLVNTTPPPGDLRDAPWIAVARHETVPFISYPYEWPFGMLQDAGLLHLELLKEALAENVILKDASAYNVQWFGAMPVFIDVPSFVPWKPGEPWLGYRQFCQMFLYPLFLQAYKGVSYHPWMRGAIDGIDPEEMARLFSLFDGVRSGMLTHVFLHAQLQKNHAGKDRSVKKDLASAGFSKEMILANVRGLRSVVERLRWNPERSTWSEYATERSYSAEEYEAKKRFVQSVLKGRRYRLAWDLGCNSGEFSELLADHAETVVAMDADAFVIERFYRALKRKGERRILPLVMNLVDPSPALGWRGLERKALFERGRPDLVLALALIHHLSITANVPLDEVVRCFGQIGGALVVEYVPLYDPMVKRLLRNKDGAHPDYDDGYFERCLEGIFNIVRTLTLGTSGRRLYYCEPRQST